MRYKQILKPPSLIYISEFKFQVDINIHWRHIIDTRQSEHTQTQDIDNTYHKRTTQHDTIDHLTIRSIRTHTQTTNIKHKTTGKQLIIRSRTQESYTKHQTQAYTRNFEHLIEQIIDSSYIHLDMTSFDHYLNVETYFEVHQEHKRIQEWHKISTFKIDMKAIVL